MEQRHRFRAPSLARPLVATALLLLASPVAARAGTGEQRPNQPVERPRTGPAGVYQVDLGNGDQVLAQVSPRGTGKPNVLSVKRRSSGQGAPMLRYTHDNSLYVMPAGAAAEVEAGRADPAPFNVSELVRRASGGPVNDATARSGAGNATAGAELGDQKTVSVTIVDRLGQRVSEVSTAPPSPGFNRALFLDLTTGDLAGIARDKESVALPEGRYLVLAPIATREPGKESQTQALVVYPELVIDASDTAVTLDARVTRRVTTTVDQPNAQVQEGVVGASVLDPAGDPLLDVWLPLSRAYETYAGSPAGIVNPGMYFYHREQLEEPTLQLNVEAPQQSVVVFGPAANHVPALRFTGTKRLRVVYGGNGTIPELTSPAVRDSLVLLTLSEEQSVDRVLVAERANNVAAAGGVGVLFTGDDGGGPTIPKGEVSIPIGYSFDSYARQLVELTKQGPVTAELRGLPASRYRYEIMDTERGRVPDRQNLVLHDADLATTRATYRATGDDGIGCARSLAGYGPGNAFQDGGCSVVPWPFTRTEYFTPGKCYSASSNFQNGLELSWSKKETYQAGKHYTVDWNKAMIGPALPTTDVSWFDFSGMADREGDRIRLDLPIGDAGGHAMQARTFLPEDNVPDYTFAGKMTLERDGAAIAPVASETFATAPTYGLFDVPADPARYRLHAELTRTQPSRYWPISTGISATWEFASGHTANREVLPMLEVRANADVDERNRAVAGATMRLPITVRRQGGGATVSKVAGFVSYDDGKTWQVLPVTTHKGQWLAQVTNPESGFVSFRFQAKDTNGNSVDETILRAYGVQK